MADRQSSSLTNSVPVEQVDQDSSRERGLPDKEHGKETPGEDDFPEGEARAWSVAAGTAGVLFCSFGYLNSFGVFQEYYQSHQLSNHTASQIAWIGSLQGFFIFLSSLAGGPLFDRYGAKVIRPAVVAQVFTVIMNSLCKKYYQFMLAQGLLSGISTGLDMCPAMSATPQYFNKKRGAAMGLSITDSSIGGIIFPIARGKMLANPTLGFGWSVRNIGFIMLAILTPSCIAIKARLPPRKAKLLLPSAFKEAEYVALIAGAFLTAIGMFTPFVFLPTYGVAQGMDPTLASYLLAIANAASFPGRVLPGILMDVLGRYNMFFAAGVSTGILILCWMRITSNAAIIVFAALIGFCSGTIVSGMTVCLASVPKSPQNIGTYMGMGMAVVSFAVLIGSPVSGELITRYHSFDRAFIFTGVMCLAGSFVVHGAKWASGVGLLSRG